MKTWVDSHLLQRFLEIIPGFCAWMVLLLPFILAPYYPEAVGIFILCYSLYWLIKTINISRHMVVGFQRLKRDMKIDWLLQCKKVSDLKNFQKELEEKYKKSKNHFDFDDLLTIQNLKQKQNRVKKWEDIIHLVIVAISKETLEIVEPTVKTLLTVNYPSDKIILVFACEDEYKKGIEPIVEVIKKRYAPSFKDFRYYYHLHKEKEIKNGKGPNITNAGKAYWEENKHNIDKPDNVLVTTLDADHIVHSEYFSRLTYLYITDPARDQKSYQPIPLLFNNIWDAAAPNRVSAIGSSFWQIVESMRSYRLRTFAAHTQSLSTLLLTDFWATHTIVEDGHQYWRTYFALNGNHLMVPMFIPVYQDAVLGETRFSALKSQYMQMRRWAWGVSDFPYVIKKCIKHKEIPIFDRILQITRQFTGTFSWATSSFLLAGAWIPLLFNKHFQDTILAQNISIYSSQMLQLAWVGVFVNVWITLSLLPPKPKRYGLRRQIAMIFQWIIAPPVAIFLSSLPAMESQTRLMLGKYLDSFCITPKIRKSEPHTLTQKS